MAKPLEFLGNTHSIIMGFPVAARKATGHELNEVQEGRDPSDWKPMKSVGAGVREIRVSVDGNAFRTIYIVKLSDTVYVLHAFQKKTRRTPQQDIELAKRRLKDLKAELQQQKKE